MPGPAGGAQDGGSAGGIAGGLARGARCRGKFPCPIPGQAFLLIHYLDTPQDLCLHQVAAITLLVDGEGLWTPRYYRSFIGDRQAPAKPQNSILGQG